jgi:hypothetical protein
VDELARDLLSDRERWQERADAAAALSTPFALDAADRALRGGLHDAPSGPLEAGAYELHVTGLDHATLAIAADAKSPPSRSHASSPWRTVIAGASIPVGAVTAAVLVRPVRTPLPPPELRLSLPEIEGGGRAVARPPPQPGELR